MAAQRHTPLWQRRFARWGRLAGMTLALLAVCTATLAVAGPRPAAAGPAPIIAYRGLGAWVDLYDSWANPGAVVTSMAAHHVRTLYIETSNYSRPYAVNKPAAMAQFIIQAHAHGMRVVAWYLPQFKNIQFDLKRSLAAIRFRTPNNQKFDSFGLDIEDSSVAPASTRSARLVTLSKKIRAAVGKRYPLGAITPSPYGMTVVHPTYWPNFPFQKLAAIYDVMVPMGYYTYHGNSYAEAYRDTWQNFHIIRDKTGMPGIPIHIIGGLGESSSVNEVKAFVRCVRENGGLGASMYDFSTTKANAWQFLGLIPVNPRQPRALPVALGFDGILGNVPHQDASHPKEVFVNAGRPSGGQVLHYQVFDAQNDEVCLLVNWHNMGFLPAGPANDWSAEQTIVIPASKLNASGDTEIGFVAAGSYPSWHVWGVRGVQLTPAP